jgi:L-ascorbate metabolism protein UlaG (beta-lactamase superfamily)
MRIHYLGHAAFVLRFETGHSILMDYGVSNAYGLPSPVYDLSGVEPSVVTFSHNHPDHRRPGAAFTSARVLAGGGSLTLDGMTITSIRTSEMSIETPDNASFVIVYGGFRILHLADAQAYIAVIDDPVVKHKVKARYPDKYDLVFMTIDGRSEIAGQAATFLDVLAPARAIPMHYWSGEAKTDFLSELERLNRQGRSRTKRFTIAEPGGSDFSLYADSPAFGTRVISLEPAPLVLATADSRPFEPGPAAETAPEAGRAPQSAGLGRAVRMAAGTAAQPAGTAAQPVAARPRSGSGMPAGPQLAAAAPGNFRAAAGVASARRPMSAQLPSRNHQSAGARGGRELG